MDKDLQTLLQAIRKVVASDHRIRDKISDTKKVCTVDQDTQRMAAQESSKRRIILTKEA